MDPWAQLTGPDLLLPHSHFWDALWGRREQLSDPRANTSSSVSDSIQEAPVKIETTIADTLPALRASAGAGDYFSGSHDLSREANPFEYQFSGGSASGPPLHTPGGTKLPSVSALTSLTTHAQFWPHDTSLRSGPLSPAMLTGPARDDYFSDAHHARANFPGITPIESSLRSGLTPGGPGLTPGGGGTMFPQTSPGYSGLLATTPGGLEFERTAMNARRASEMSKITSQPQEPTNGLDVKPPQPRQQQRHFDESNVNDAANGLFQLANANHVPQQTNHYTVAPQTVLHATAHPMQHPQDPSHMAHQQQDQSHIGHQRQESNSNQSSGMSEEEQQNKPAPRGKGKRPAQENGNGGRKASGLPAAKAPANKKSKGNNGNATLDEPTSEEEQPDMNKDEYHADGKKMTEDEKRKNFLERNRCAAFFARFLDLTLIDVRRVAALKCRQRKKQWLQNLQSKVELYTLENESLSNTVTALRDELVSLKALLLAHKDCPVSHSQGLGNGGVQQIVDSGYNPHINPYGMALPQHPHMMTANQAFQQQQQQRRES